MRLTEASRRTFPTFGLLILGALASPVWAACKMPLPTPSLRLLDSRTDADPMAVDAEVNQRLAKLDGTDNLQWAELLAIQAEAASLMDNPSRVREAIAAGRQRLGQLSDEGIRGSLGFRMALIEADSAVSPAELAAALANLTRLEPTLPAESLQHACLLIMRSGVNRRLFHNDDSVRDGLLAHRLATEANAPSAAADTAFELASTYLRAGLLVDAIGMADEVVHYSRSTHQLGALAHGLQVKAWILAEMQRYEEALTATAEARELNLQLHSAVDVTYADQGRCDVLLKMGRVDAA